MQEHLKDAARAAQINLDAAIDGIDQVTLDLVRVRQHLYDIRQNGLAAHQVPTMAGAAGRPLGVDVARVADVARQIALVNELRHLIVLAANEMPSPPDATVVVEGGDGQAQRVDVGDDPRRSRIVTKPLGDVDLS
jgi:hypothetical protein